MIARLSNAGVQTSSRPLASQQDASSSTLATSHLNGLQQQQNSAQSKRKRAKLIDLLLTTNWSKQSQQVPNLMKLNKILLACDTNFLDEKSGESPLSLAISSPQIHQATLSLHNQQQPLLAASCSQSASLFNLQCQSASMSLNGGGMSQLMLQQTSKSEIIQSKAPLVERILLLLVKSGAQIDFRNSDGRTPLHTAAIKSNFWALKTLLDLGAATDYRDINGLTPLYYSILYKAALKVAQLLLIQSKANSSLLSQPTDLATSTRNGPNDNRLPAYGITDQHGWQEVHQACKLGLDAHLEKLLYYGCDINAKISGSGNTPLHVAAINDQLNCAKVLLMRGADKTITNNSHQTAHQVAVISNNMEMAEFIAEHNDSKVVPFQNLSSNQGTDHHNNSQNNNHGSMRGSSLASSFSMANMTNSQQQHKPIAQQQQQVVAMKPLRLDVASSGQQQQQHNSMMSVDAASTSSNCASSGSGSGQPQSLLSISALQNTNCQQLNVQVNNISPCLSQRSCATSNTTSSSGVCCDGEGSNSAEELNHQQLVQQYKQQLPPAQSQLASSLSQHSSLTMLTIDNNNNNSNSSTCTSGSKTNNNNSSTFIPGAGAFSSLLHRTNNDEMHDANANEVAENEDDVDDGHEDDEDDLRSSGSSSNGLYSLMSEERPLFVGSIVEAASEYQSGDPSHLQLRRGDLIEVLEYTADQLQFGQLPRLANKPMLYGKRRSDGMTGLFPSFCVNRTKQNKSILRQRLPTTGSFINRTTATKSATSTASYIESQQDMSLSGANELSQHYRHDTKGLHESQSLIMMNQPDQQKMNLNQQITQQVSSQNISNENANQPKVKFREMQVTLTKSRGGFGFALRGAKVDPSTLAANKGQPNKFAIDERLMAANNLVSLQYLDEIEMGGAAYQANLKRGDFIVAVNGQDVRLHSHEQVVSLIRQSGDRVNLTLATPVAEESIAPSYTSKTLPKIKPEPPKRDPNTTLTRNRAQRVKSMFIRMHHQQEQQQMIPQNEPFDSNRPLPMTPSAESLQSPTGSLNLTVRYLPNNLSHNFHSAQSLSSTATDSRSISSASTLSADRQSLDQQQHQLMQQYHQSLTDQITPTHSSSSTTTLTTVAAVKPNESAIKPTSGSQICGNDLIGNISSTNNATLAVNNQPTYQPAVIMTTKRNSVSHKTSPNSPPKSNIQSNSIPEAHSPTPPPPPPPLPDFTVSPPAASRLSQRRISAPIDLSTSEMIKNGKSLLKKRESLAVVGQSNSQNSQDAPVPAQFGAVAAACAAAANNRMLRQQQQQQQQEQESQQVPDLAKQTQQLKLSESIQEAPSSPDPPPLPPPLPAQHQRQLQQPHLHQTKQSRPLQQPQQFEKHSHQHHHHQHSHHHHHHQQPKQLLVDQQHFHPIHNHNQNHHNHSDEYQQHYQPEAVHATKGPASEFIQQQQAQQQQLFLLHQKHLLQQQLRQQQLLQQQQQQLKLQQQVQLQQRLCLYGKHGLSLGIPNTQDDHLTHAHNHTHLEHHHRAYDTYDNHHHRHHDHQNANRCYDTSTTRSRHLCRRLNK